MRLRLRLRLCKANRGGGLALRLPPLKVRARNPGGSLPTIQPTKQLQLHFEFDFDSGRGKRAKTFGSWTSMSAANFQFFLGGGWCETSTSASALQGKLGWAGGVGWGGTCTSTSTSTPPPDQPTNQPSSFTCTSASTSTSPL